MSAPAEALILGAGSAGTRSTTSSPAARVTRRWAGLRCFVADHDPVAGPEPARPDFLWLSGQGRFGIMTAPAMARIAAGLLLEGRMPPEIELEPTALKPARLRAR